MTQFFEQLQLIDCSKIERILPQESPDGGGSMSNAVIYHSAKDRVASNFKEGSPLRARGLYSLSLGVTLGSSTVVMASFFMLAAALRLRSWCGPTIRAVPLALAQF